MKTILKESIGVIIPRLQPIIIYLDRCCRDCNVITRGNTDVFSYTRAVALDNFANGRHVCEGMLHISWCWDKYSQPHQPIKFEPKENVVLNFETSDAERLECVYDLKGLVVKRTETSLTTHHALMLPPRCDGLGRCLAILEIETSFLSGKETRRLLSAKGNENPFWGSYATRYKNCDASIDFVPEKRSVGIINFTALYIGDVPVCGLNINKNLLLAYDDFSKLANTKTEV